MTVFFDHQAFCIQTYGGLSRYYTELIAGLSHTQTVIPLLPLRYTNNQHLQEARLHHRSFAANLTIPKKEQLITCLSRWYDIWAMQKQSFDVFHATYYNPYFLPYLNIKRKTPFVVTFLDMIHEKLGNQYPSLAQDKAILHHKRLLAASADRLIAVSESTKRDVIDLLAVSPDNIEVIYHGSSFADKQNYFPEASDYLHDRPYLLYVGLRSGYKNFSGMLQALHPLLKQEKLAVICVGGGPFSLKEKKYIHALGINNLVSQQSATDDQLINLYKHAIAFIFPSLYEGFGMPIVEAFACGCPCILSNRSSLPEIGGDAALYIDHDEPEMLLEAVNHLIYDNELRQKLIDRGLTRVKKFSWQNAVNQTVNLYQSLSTSSVQV